MFNHSRNTSSTSQLCPPYRVRWDVPEIISSARLIVLLINSGLKYRVTPEHAVETDSTCCPTLSGACISLHLPTEAICHSQKESTLFIQIHSGKSKKLLEILDWTSQISL